MIVPLDDLRYEIKFVVPITESYRLTAWMREHTAAFGIAYPPRRVNNVYFDSYGLATYEENLSGVSERTKIRLRWYGLDSERLSGKLELKMKRNRLGWKNSFPIKDLQFLGRSWQRIARDLREQLPLEGRSWLDDHPEPVLINRYLRQYYVSRNGRIRITLDTELSAYDQRLARSPNRTARTNLPDVMVLEAKADSSHFDELGDVVSSMPSRVGRFSKYVSGLQTALTAS
jgi:SPX domain protein involved in polyphosphate accumulation